MFIKTDPPAQADLILVLGGDDHGARILKGAELAREGFAPIVVASNGNYDYGRGESSLAIDFAVQRGYPPELFLRTDWRVDSTREEAAAAITLMRNRGARSAIVVTSIWHTARARRVYRRQAPDLKFSVVGTEDVAWNNGKWWETRRGRKSMFLEVLKTIADYLEI